MKIALAQMDVIAGRPDKNLDSMLSMIEEARNSSADLIVFPEMCVGGYLLGDKWAEDEFCEDLMEYEKGLINASAKIAIAYGNVHIDSDIERRTGDKGFHPNKDGRSRKYNAVRVFQYGKPAERVRETTVLPKGTQPKTLLPNYRVFDDERYFFSLKDVALDSGVPLKELEQPFLIKTKSETKKIGFELCEDLWCGDYRAQGKVLNPTKMLIENGAELIVNLSASPWTFGKNSSRDRRIEFLKKESGDSFVPFLYVNCAGVQNNGKNIITFDGGTTCYNRNGKPVMFSRAPYEEEIMLVEDTDLEQKGQERIEEPMIAQKFKAVVRGIKHMKESLGLNNYPRFVIGLSGGIDSSLTAALLCVAVGAENVIGVNMPSRYNSEKTKDSARRVADKLGISYGIIPIEQIVKANQKAVDSVDLDNSGKKLTSFNMENVQAKIRGTSLLSNIASKYNALFTSNGNKLEVALGYATLYGDWGGAIAPIADLTKTEIVQMSKYINNEIFHDEVIPSVLIPDKLWMFGDEQIQPGAELKENHVSPIKFGYHCALITAVTDYKKKGIERIMEWYLEGSMERNLGISTELIARWGMDDPKEFVRDLEWFYRTIQNNVFKRVQAPPIILTSKSAYGYDIRESVLPHVPSKKFESLKKEVLAMKRYECKK
jgi:NAD+ synthase (glutamine-hydrolysing)